MHVSPDRLSYILGYEVWDVYICLGMGYGSNPEV